MSTPEETTYIQICQWWRWPLWPFLCLKHRTTTEDQLPKLAVIGPPQANGIPLYLSRIDQVQHAFQQAQLDTLRVRIYRDPKAIIADGWIVD